MWIKEKLKRTGAYKLYREYRAEHDSIAATQKCRKYYNKLIRGGGVSSNMWRLKQ